MPDVGQAQTWYDAAKTYFMFMPPLSFPMAFVVDAPFGRFSPATNSKLLVDGIKSWIFMELVSPITITYAYLHSPLSPVSAGSAPPLSLSHPPTFLFGLFLLHYLNRALISPLRTPSRSKSHISVTAGAVVFNVVNGSLMGAYLSSPGAKAFLNGAFERPLFWAGVTLWVIGLAGNILHDEVLLDLRRSARAKGKARAARGGEDNNGKTKDAITKEHYAIPHGYLYSLISYPNYFCEWVEWLGFALAASPAPALASFSAFRATVSPPWLFFMAELFLMLPRAYKGHLWYHSKFPEYPKGRKAIVPFLL